MGFLIKMAYKNEGYSHWRNENTPITIYNTANQAYQQACAIFYSEVDLQTLDSSVTQTIKSFIDQNAYEKAVDEINFSDTIRFIVVPTVMYQGNQQTTAVVSATDNSSSVTGVTCRKCYNRNDYAIPDAADGMHTCYACKFA